MFDLQVRSAILLNMSENESEIIELDPDYVPTKTYSDLLAEGIQHKGGLEELALEEQDMNRRRTIEVNNLILIHPTFYRNNR
mgnify:CR=1 FL=1